MVRRGTKAEWIGKAIIPLLMIIIVLGALAEAVRSAEDGAKTAGPTAAPASIAAPAAPAAPAKTDVASAPAQREQVAATADATTKAAPIRVATFDVDGTGQRAKNMKRCLSPSPDFVLSTVTAEDIRKGALSKLDVLIVPAGSGSKQAATLEAKGCKAVKDFVKNGGGYVGFCAGSYLASAGFKWSLGIINAKVVDFEHWARGTGDITLKMTMEGKKILGATDDIVTCSYRQGPLLAGGDLADVPAFTILATYNSEIAQNGAPPGVMIGTTAIAAGTYGKGRVICFSPHPESVKGLEDYVRRAVRWAAGRL